MKTIFSMMILLALCTGCAGSRMQNRANKLVTVSIMDNNGMSETVSNADRLKQYKNVNWFTNQSYQKVLRIYARDSKGNIPAYINSYHPNGQPKQYLEVVNSRAFGKYNEWHENGVMKLEATVIGGEADLSANEMETWLFDGHAFAWNEEGNLTADINYEKGNLEGESIYFHSNGNIWKRISFENNLREGVFYTYLDNGELLQTIVFYKGKKHGEATRYWDCNRIASEEIYQDGALTYGKYYDIDGRLITQIIDGTGFKATFGRESVSELHEYRHGVQEGEVKVFGNDGLIIRSYHVKNGIKHGEELEFYEMPRIRHLPKISLNWYNGKIQGVVRTWYDNGVLESQREMSNNQKNGISTAWYRDGSLMLIEEYEQDRIVKGEYFKRRERMPLTKIFNGEGTATLFDSDGNFLRKISYRNGYPLG